MIGLKITRFGGGWGMLPKIPVIGKAFDKIFDRAPKKFADAYAEELRKAAKSNGMAANSVSTLILKGAGKPLVDRGTMIKSIKTKRLKPREFFAGVDPTVLNSRGQSVAAVAMAQNTGYVIPVTDEIRTFMQANGIRVRADTEFFVVPPRPFLSVALEKIEPKLRKLVKKAQVEIVQTYNRVKG